MNVRAFWVRAMECMCAQARRRFILSSERVLGGMELEPMLTPREKSPLPEKSLQRRTEPTTLHQAGHRAQHTTIKQDTEPNTLPSSRTPSPTHYHQAGHRAQYTTINTLPSSKTASPTHYHQAGHRAQHTTIKKDSQPNTLPSRRTASPTHYHQAGHRAQHTTIKQDNKPNTLPSSRTPSPTHYHQAGHRARHTTSDLFRPHPLPHPPVPPSPPPPRPLHTVDQPVYCVCLRCIICLFWRAWCVLSASVWFRILLVLYPQAAICTGRGKDQWGEGLKNHLSNDSLFFNYVTWFRF